MTDYNSYKSWPFNEAKKIVKRFEKNNPKDKIIFETGYGPSGLPHIGTFGEVLRTNMVRFCYEKLTGKETDLIAFSDDMDGFRKVPDNIPNKEKLSDYLDYPLTSVPDPFELFNSFGEHNNSKLKDFLNRFNLPFSFQSSTDAYKSGLFNETIKKIIKNYDEIINVVLPTLGEERRKSYSPFFPISEITGKILQVPIEEINNEEFSISYYEDGVLKSKSVLDGNCKLQWKVDWAMRWMALDVDYEMCGKDLIESVDLANKICLSMNKKAPVNLIYEMFLDEKGEKISKSIGNGISVDQWLRYASQESLSLFMFQKPRTAKKLFFDVIPKSVDEYFSFLKKYHQNNEIEKLENPVWHIHSGNPPKYESDINFNSLMNLVSISNTTDKKIICDFIKEYDSSIDLKENSYVDNLIQYAINYYIDFILPKKNYLDIEEKNIKVFEDLLNYLKSINSNLPSENIQSEIYEIGKKNNFSNLRDFFKLIYQVLLGQEEGPRLGSFIKLYGIKKTCELLENSLKKIK